MVVKWDLINTSMIINCQWSAFLICVTKWKTFVQPFSIHHGKNTMYNQTTIFQGSTSWLFSFWEFLSALINQDKEQGITYFRKGLVEKKCPSYIWTTNNGVTGVKRKRQKKNIFGEMMLHELFSFNNRLIWMWMEIILKSAILSEIF